MARKNKTILHPDVEAWRSQYNPLRGLSVQRAVSLLESFNRGDMTELQWLYFHLEGADETLYALVERRTSALLELDWNIKLVPESEWPKGISKRFAEEQQNALRMAYERIDNLSEAIEFLAMATFRGYSHLQKQDLDGDGFIDHLEPLDQWNWVRDGINGDWYWNPKAQCVTASALKHREESQIERGEFIIRAVQRHINRIGLVCRVRKALAEKDWTAYSEIYGVPGGVVTMPAQSPGDKEGLYMKLAEDIASGGSGVLPSGSSYTANPAPHGTGNPFKEFIRHQQESVVLAGTGGLLTMLTESGSGTLAGNAHQETFAKIARGEAKLISEIFQKQFDAEILAQLFPESPRLAYFEIAANEEADTSGIVDDAQKLGLAGYEIDPAQLSEKTGYRLKVKETPRPSVPFAPMQNRAKPMGGLSKLKEELGKAVARDLKPVGDRLAAIETLPANQQRAALEKLLTDLPALEKEINSNPESSAVLENAIEAGIQSGVEQRTKSNEKND
jgi:phage gp29-like protein